jgi:hypothetical protein
MGKNSIRKAHDAKDGLESGILAPALACIRTS